jgi:hypothetical protein
MKVPDTRRNSQSIGAEHRLEMNVLGTILNNNHTTGGKRIGQRRIGDDLRWGFWGRERNNLGKPAVIRYALCHAADCEQRDGSDR